MTLSYTVTRFQDLTGTLAWCHVMPPTPTLPNNLNISLAGFSVLFQLNITTDIICSILPFQTFSFLLWMEWNGWKLKQQEKVIGGMGGPNGGGGGGGGDIRLV